MRHHLRAPALLILLTGANAVAEDIPLPPPVVLPPGALPQPAVPAASLWTQKGRFGAFFNNTSTSNADESRDSAIGGAARSTAVLAALDYQTEWTSGKNSVENIFKGRYGRVSNNGQGFTENEDEARYDGVYRRELSAPQFIYLGWGVETVWTGPYTSDPTRPPDNAGNPFDPLLARVSGGYGQRFSHWIPEDKFEWRLGARAQKSWGSQLADAERGIETGIEALIRYEAVPLSWRKDLKWFFQYEGFAEFNDLAHTTNLVTAGLTFQLSKYINVELALRAYYETRPKEDGDKVLPGYNQWSVKQDTLIGLVYNF